MRLFVSAVALLFAGSTFAERIDNFVLLDQQGDAHELYYHDESKLIGLMSHANQCSADSVKRFEEIAQIHSDHGAVFFFLNSNLEDDRQALAANAQALGLKTPILDDETQLIGEALNLVKSGEVLLIDPKSWEVKYRGGVEQAEAAMTAMVKGEALPAPSTIEGCDVAYPHANEQSHAQISYSKDIAPLLQEKCSVCHTEGGLGPWAMSDYNMVLGFSPMIREVIRTKRMPPWHADPHVGVWKNDISLTAEQAQMLVHWIEAGSPRGEGPDPLAETKTAVVEWPLGEPDLILDIPEYTVPVSGVVDYQFPSVTNPLDKGVWIKAASVVPGDREVVHHILAGTIDADASEQRRNSGVFDNYLIGYAPGNESHTFPSDTGVYVPPGGEFQFQMHYTPVGRETVDRSKIGLYFHEQQPENFYRQSVVVDPTIEIEANAARHEEVAYYLFEQPVLLHDLIPHAHYRGVASKFEVVHPNGHKETILSVPNYDFNWQRTYEFVEPRRLEAGTRLVHTTWYDNSAANPRNPDPNRTVPWGLQSWDEMLYGGFSYTYVDETTEAPIHDEARAQTSLWVGVLDENMDGYVSWRELPKEMKKRLVQGFKAVDKDGDGKLNMDEMHKLTLQQSQARAERRANQEQNAADAR